MLLLTDDSVFAAGGARSSVPVIPEMAQGVKPAERQVQIWRHATSSGYDEIAGSHDTSRLIVSQVGSKEVTLPGGLEAFPQASYSASANPTSGYSNDSNSLPTYSQNMHLHTRPSLPTLHTRSSWMDNYDQYENSPVDAYTYSSASMPRQDSYAGSFGGLENYKSWHTTAPASTPLPAPTQSSYYDQPPSSYTFGNLQAPSYTVGQTSRLPSVTADTLSPLNMGSLHSSLPIQTAQERRLPVPYTVHYPTQHSASQIPQVRPLGSFSEPRAPTHGIHSRHAMPWSADSTAGATRTASNSAHNPAVGLPALQLSQPQQPYINIPPISEPAFGYQFSHNHQPTTTGSPAISPTTLAGHSDNFTTTTTGGMSPLPPATTYSYGPTTISSDYSIPTMTTSNIRDSRTPMPLYSFSADERPTTASSEADHDDDGGVTGSSTTSSLSSQASTGNLQAYNNVNLANSNINIRHPQPQRSLEGLRRREDPEQRRAATAQRMSVSNLSAARY